MLEILLLLGMVAADEGRGGEGPLPEPWDYAAPMARVARGFRGRPGVVLHVGDSITYANPYGQWARGGRGRTDADRGILAWMHAGSDDETDGWYLARFDHPDGGRSDTACGGLQADELLAGGRNHLPPLEALLDGYRPQIVVLLIGTNDVTNDRPVAAYRGDVERAVDLILARGIIPIVSTLPPHPGRTSLGRSYNEALRRLARSRGLPLIDFEREILRRRPDDWNGTLLEKDDPHPSTVRGDVTPSSAPTPENLRGSGYLLRGWLSVRKIAEVKRAVLDRSTPDGPRPIPDRPVAVAAPPPPGALRVRVTRDTWFSNVGAEADGNNGSATRLKVKSNQEMSLIDIDPGPLRGRVVVGADLLLRSAGEPRLRRVTVGSFGAEWVEGTGSGYTPQDGSSTFNHRRHPDVPWTLDGGDLCGVILGAGGTLWRMSDASPPDARGWQRVPVDPAVIAARVAGISHGFLLFDDTGTEWTREGEAFALHHMPNRFVSSRESGESDAPYFVVALGPEDRTPPETPGDLRSDAGDLPAGEAWVSWVTPPDRGPAGTVGFLISADGKPVPRQLIPLAGRPGDRVRMHLRDLGLAPGAGVPLSVRAVDGAGNPGVAAEAVVRLSSKVALPLPLPDPAPLPVPPRQSGAGAPRIAGHRVSVVDELDKVHPLTGRTIPPQPARYLLANHLWDASTRRVQLHASRNEFVAFQVLLEGDGRDVSPSLSFDGEGAFPVEFGRYHPVATSQGPLPDPIVPLDFAAAPIPGQTSQGLHCEIYVPRDARAGAHAGRLILGAGGQSLAIDVALHVWDFTLPDVLSFLPEMNCYGLPRNERDFYRLAHAHRTVLNRVPYYQSGAVDDGCAPAWDGRKLDWSAWDRRFGPYFDGTAFADLPRRGVPIECFYLPLHENWPSPMEGNYDGDYWADRAFPPRYRRAFVEASRQVAEHVNARKWDGTLFQCFLNNKSNFKADGWSRGSSPWLLDEPSNFQDYWALRYFGAAFHEGVGRARGPAKLAFRCDISRPQWQRDALDGLLDCNVVGGAMRLYHRLVFDRKAADGAMVVEYGGSNAIEEANVQPVGWCLDAWALGCDGVLPWQTVGTPDSWRHADPLALLYPGRGGTGAIPSIRLKAYRRGEQDVEYLTLLSRSSGEPRWALGQRVREALHLAAEHRKGPDGARGEDAGLVRFDRLRPQELWALRVRIGAELSKARPAPRRELVDRRFPPRDPARLAPGLVSRAGGD